MTINTLLVPFYCLNPFGWHVKWMESINSILGKWYMFFFEYDITNLRVLCEWHNKTLFCLPCYLLSGWIIFAFILKSLVSWYIYYIIVCWFLRSNGGFFFSPNFVYLQAHAASAVLNFSENCTPDILTPYLDGIVSKLLVLLQVSQTNKQTKKTLPSVRLYEIK